MGMKIWWQHIFPPQEQIERETGMTLTASVEDAKGKSERCTYKSAPPEIRDAMRSLTYCSPVKS